MDMIWDGIKQAVVLLFHGDPLVMQIAWLSLLVSGFATLVSLLIGIPLGAVLGLTRFPGRRFVVSMFLWRNGPLGILHLMYTPYAMIIAQFIIALPIVVGFTMAATQSLDPKLRMQITSLGASRWQTGWILLKEARLPLLAAIMAGFGAVISEVGASMMVGGNIQGQTRVLTTDIVGENSKGEFAYAIALSVILMALVYAVNFILTLVQQRSKVK
jgi:tungstate transport system permease protein